MKIVLYANTDWYLYNFRINLGRALKALGIEVVMVTPPGPYGPHLRAAGFRWIPVQMNRRSLNAMSELRLLFELTRLYRKEHPNLVHHFTVKCVVYGTIASLCSGVKSRINAVTGLGHVFISNTLKARALRIPVRSLLRLALCGEKSRLILQNQDDSNLFQKQKLVRPEQIRIIRGSGVDIKHFSPSQRHNSTESTFRVLLATRLLREKGVYEYIRAARDVNRVYPYIEFLMAGAPDDGNPSSITPLQLSEWREKGLVKVLGQVVNMAELLKQVDLVVLPSYREGTPKILLEAAASGLPIVTTDVPGCREVVTHELNGILIPARDAPALSQAILYLARNRDLARSMGKKGREKIILDFQDSNIIKETISVYQELLPDFPRT